MFDKMGSDLSFSDKTSLWSILESGDYAKDCQSGREAARELMNYVAFQGMPNLMPSVASAIAKNGRWGGLEIGFFQEIGETFTPGAGLND